MAEAILHETYRAKLQKLPPEQQLVIIYAMMDYAAGKPVSIEDPVADIMFDFIKDRIDADSDSYERASNYHAQNGRKGAEARWNRQPEEQSEKMATDGKDSKDSNAILPMATDGKDSISISKSKSKSISNIEKESKEKEAPTGAARFVPPSIEEVEAYCRERGNSLSAKGFVSYYESNGWKVGKSPMKDWKAAVRTWEQRDKKTVEGPKKPANKWHNFEQRNTDYDAILKAEG